MLSVSFKKSKTLSTAFTRERLSQGTQESLSEVSAHQEKPSCGQRALRRLWTSLIIFFGLLKSDQGEQSL